jgi:hypothetical protein
MSDVMQYEKCFLRTEADLTDDLCAGNKENIGFASRLSTRP